MSEEQVKSGYGRRGTSFINLGINQCFIKDIQPSKYSEGYDYRFDITLGFPNVEYERTWRPGFKFKRNVTTKKLISPDQSPVKSFYRFVDQLGLSSLSLNENGEIVFDTGEVCEDIVGYLKTKLRMGDEEILYVCYIEPNYNKNTGKTYQRIVCVGDPTNSAALAQFENWVQYIEANQNNTSNHQDNSESSEPDTSDIPY